MKIYILKRIKKPICKSKKGLVYKRDKTGKIRWYKKVLKQKGGDPTKKNSKDKQKAEQINEEYLNQLERKQNNDDYLEYLKQHNTDIKPGLYDYKPGEIISPDDENYNFFDYEPEDDFKVGDIIGPDDDEDDNENDMNKRFSNTQLIRAQRQLKKKLDGEKKGGKKRKVSKKKKF